MSRLALRSSAALPRGLCRLLPCAVLVLTLALPGGIAWAQEETDRRAADPGPPSPCAPEQRDRLVCWSDGLHARTRDGQLTLKIGGQVQFDVAAFSEHTEAGFSLGALENGAEFRRVRLYADGTFARRFTYRLQYDFASNNPPHLKDAYVLAHLPKLPVQAGGGRFRTFLSVEGTTTAPNTTFMERGLLSAFLPSRNTGIVVLADKERQPTGVRWVVSVVEPANQFGFRSTDDLGVALRASYAWHRGETRTIHVGADYMHRNVRDTVRFLERPESHIAPEFVDTGDIAASAVDLLIAEFAWVEGPFSLQSEYAVNYVRGHGAQAPRFDAFYIYGGYVITGERRPYDPVRGAFDRVLPDRPIDGDGFGAIEVALRYSRLDLNDQDVAGGVLDDITAALNWYPQHNSRVMFNIIRAKRRSVDPVWIFQIRLQWFI